METRSRTKLNLKLNIGYNTDINNTLYGAKNKILTYKRMETRSRAKLNLKLNIGYNTDNSNTLYGKEIKIQPTNETLKLKLIKTKTSITKFNPSLSRGCNTNLYGKKFEDKTNNETRLLDKGFNIYKFNNCNLIYNYYLSKTFNDVTITFVLQYGFKYYMKQQYNIEIFRCPDEAYIIEYNTGRTIIKIIEKKEQRVNGSIETKLWSGPSLKREYELVLGNRFEIDYVFCLSSYFKTKMNSTNQKYNILQTILSEHNIVCLFGDDDDYFETLDLLV